MSETKTTTGTQTVELFINGSSAGTRKVSPTTTVGEFVQASAKEHGIRTFCAMSGGRTIKKDEANKAVCEFTRIDIMAKDARG